MRNKHVLPVVLRIALYFLSCAILTASVAIIRLADWFSRTFAVGIREMLFTVNSPLKGADTSFLRSALKFCDIKSLLLVQACSLFFAFLVETVFSKVDASMEVGTKRRKLLSINIRFLLCAVIFALAPAMLFLRAVWSVDDAARISEYIRARRNTTNIYEDYYVRPDAELIKGGGRNLILIIMESMETTYASVEAGGGQAFTNFIPELTELAEENVNFSENRKLGGFHDCAGFTMAALFAESAGIPFSFPISGNSMGTHEHFAGGTVTLGDILSQKGYSQEFLCGSDADFAGRRQFYEQHGDYKIFDLFTAREQGYIPEDYMVWWGFEDEMLYRIARDELQELARRGSPFNLTMLTADTHHVGGYRCRLCKNDYPENLENVVACADRQVYDFVRWCQQQEFYEDTLIVILGDHRRMDTIMVADVPENNRMVYDCFINPAKMSRRPVKDRNFTTLDMFPTILSAQGFDVEGDRLGLGTDLFSDTPTYSEEWGFERFNSELQKYSEYYIDNFS